MAIFALSDPHLALGVNKPMNIFGERWQDHEKQIAAFWRQQISAQDTVILPGDISWGMTLEEAKPDLAFLHDLPGKKILLKGNHDYWWATMRKVEVFCQQQGFDSLLFLKNNAYLFDNRVICGTRGWSLPGDADFTTADQVIYQRELGRLELSLKAGEKLLAESFQENNPVPPKLIVAMHFPPVSWLNQESGFHQILKKYQSCLCIYGHLHGRGLQKAYEGVLDGVEYRLTSGDYIGFKALQL